MAEKLIAELRRKHPILADRATRGRAAAVRLFCLECMGGQRSGPAVCGVSDCALYPFRTGHFGVQEAREEATRCGDSPAPEVPR